MQVSGLRDIPSPSITNVPTAVKFFGMKAPHEGAPIIIDQPSSYLAVSELVVRALDGKMFSEDSVNWQQYVANLPQSRGGVRERQRHRHPVSGQALCPAEWR
ncbi:cellulose biosynthesis protein BcsG [Klebsiella pneumoniae subsp. pneumoniae]|nr:cellulose biosynthesis protein BcsG [Klebsiella pneumoniae subsp. pneumoniae]